MGLKASATAFPRAMVHTFKDMAADWQSRRHRARLAAPSYVCERIVNALEQEGGMVTSLDELGFPGTAAMLASAAEIKKQLAAESTHAGRKSYMLNASDKAIESHPALTLWGLESVLIESAEWYMGKSVAYRGLLFRRDLPDGQVTETRLWHRDDEDRRIMKVIVYLNDVDEKAGPFEYVPKRFGSRIRPIPGSGGRIQDAELEKMVPRSHWVACVGRAGTVSIADTCSVYHRGKAPESGDRYAMFYAYNSASPRHPEHCQPMFSREKFSRAVPPLTPLQQRALEYNY